MSKKEVLEKLRNGIISVIRCEDFDTAEVMCETILSEGINALEITFTVKDADVLIKHLKEKHPEAIIGAGTVMNLDQARRALESGSDFIVAPCIVKEIGEFCTEHDIFCSLGAGTATEAYNSSNLGSDVVKLFPGECLGANMIKAIKAPMPQLEIMPTGGVDDTNINNWFEKGAFAVGVGGYLTKGINKDNLDVLKKRCQKLLNAVQRK